MNRELWALYEEELRFLREEARGFHGQYPTEAEHLGVDAQGAATDPHVKRLIEAVAQLTARVRQKIDDDFPELTDALLGVLYPHLLAPVPSMAVVQYVPAAGMVDLVGGLVVARGQYLDAPERDGVRCRYRTVYPTRLWPLVLSKVSVAAPTYRSPAPLPDGTRNRVKAVLRVRFDSLNGLPLAAAGLGARDPKAGGRAAPVRIFLAEDRSLTAVLYEYLFNHAVAVAFVGPEGPDRGRAAAVVGPDDAFAPVGFGPDEGMLPYPRQAFPGYRLLTEFFAYRDKFLFADLSGWDAALERGVLADRTVEVQVFFDRELPPAVERDVSANNLLLGVTPAVNLFERAIEAVPVTHRRYDYPLTPDTDHPRGYEIYSVDRVFERHADAGGEAEYDPFYSFRHFDRAAGRRYWYARRRAADRPGAGGDADHPVFAAGDNRLPATRLPDRGTAVDIHFVDLDFRPTAPADGFATFRVTCTNRDLPQKFAGAREPLVFEPAAQFPGTVRCLVPPTPTLRPQVGHGGYWRLVSHLALNHLSLADGVEGAQALREYLALYDFADTESAPDLSGVAKRVRGGVVRVAGRRDVAYLPGETGGYARGVEVTLELDEDRFVGVGAFLFAAVMDRFFALYASVNSFTRMVYKTRQREGTDVRRWPPRAGDRPLI